MRKHEVWKWLRTRTSIVLTVALVVGSAIAAQATTIKDVFDPQYYSDTYSDLKAAFGEDAEALYKHYVTYGQSEKRSVAPFIDLAKYRAKYPDLEAAFGDDWDAYLNHYLANGIYEGRNAFGTFDARAYADRYPDLKAAFGYDVLALYNHYRLFGRSEGRFAGAVTPVTSSDDSSSGSSGSSSSSSSSSSGGSNSGSNGGSNGGSNDTSDIPERVQTRGRFLDENGNPIANATVTFTRTGDVGMNGNSRVVADGTEVNEPVDDEESDIAAFADESTSGNDVSGNNTPSVSEDGNTITVITDDNGEYEATIPSGVYSVRAEARGCLVLNMSNVTIGTQGSSQAIPTFEMVNEEEGAAPPIRGVARDNTTGDSVSGVTVKIRNDWNNYDGAVVATMTTGSDGEYSFAMDRGYYTVEFVREGYGIYHVNVATTQRFNFDSRRCDGLMNPVTSEVTSDQYRIVLTWGERPSDLDSHLVGPAPEREGGSFHVYYPWDNKSYERDGETLVRLDVDDTTSYGPETVTIYRVDPNVTYYYSVYNFSSGGTENSDMSRSGANIKVWAGSRLVQEYNVPYNQSGIVWNVFKIENGRVITINTLNSDYNTIYGSYNNPDWGYYSESGVGRSRSRALSFGGEKE